MAEEAALIAEADAALEAGLYVESADVKRWIGSIGTDHETAPPKARGR